MVAIPLMVYCKHMKTVKRTSDRQGPMVTDTYDKKTVRKGLGGRTITKSVNTKTVTDLDNQKTTATGVKSKTVTKNGAIIKSKTKVLTPRKVINRYS